jgi:predicted DNA-binding transcriptional regulator AlpA
MALEVLSFDGTASRPAPSLQSVPDFCADNGISRSLFYRLVQEGRGPRLTKVCRRTLISPEAAAEWRARLERDTEQAVRSTAGHRDRRVGRGAALSCRKAA